VSQPKRHPRCYYPLKKLLRKTGMNTMDIYSKGYHYVYITLSRRNIQMIFRAHSDDSHFMVSVPWGAGCFKTLQAKIILMIG
jgi:ribosomal protein L25 (general stress protein Ctc)